MVPSVYRICFAFLGLFCLSVLRGQVVDIARGLTSSSCLDVVKFEGRNCTGMGQFGVFGNQFIAQNADGIECGCPGSTGDHKAYFEFRPVDILRFDSISISFDYRGQADTIFENYDPLSNDPIYPCAPNSSGGSHDQIVFSYIIRQ